MARRSDRARLIASYVDKVIEEAQPGDLAIQQPIKLEPVINLKPGKALGLAIAPSLFVPAEHVIQQQTTYVLSARRCWEHARTNSAPDRYRMAAMGLSLDPQETLAVVRLWPTAAGRRGTRRQRRSGRRTRSLSESSRGSRHICTCGKHRDKAAACRTRKPALPGHPSRDARGRAQHWHCERKSIATRA